MLIFCVLCSDDLSIILNKINEVYMDDKKRPDRELNSGLSVDNRRF